MRYLDRLINFIFSLFVLVLSAVVAFIAAGLIEYSYVSNHIEGFLFSNENRTITCIVSIVVFFAALKTTVFLSIPNKKKKNVVYVDTNNGKVQIAQETIESTARNAVIQYSSVKEAQARMMKEKKGVAIYMSLLVMPNTNLVELTSKAQDDVKAAVEGSTGVRVNNVDIKIKNLSEAKVKGKEEAPKSFVAPQNVEKDAPAPAGDVPMQEPLTEVLPYPEDTNTETKEE